MTPNEKDESSAFIHAQVKVAILWLAVYLLLWSLLGWGPVLFVFAVHLFANVEWDFDTRLARWLVKVLR